MSKIAGTGDVDFAKIAYFMLWLIGLYGISALFSYLQGYIMAGITAKITFRLRADISGKMHRLPFGYYDKVTQGENSQPYNKRRRYHQSIS